MVQGATPTKKMWSEGKGSVDAHPMVVLHLHAHGSIVVGSLIASSILKVFFVSVDPSETVRRGVVLHHCDCEGAQSQFAELLAKHHRKAGRLTVIPQSSSKVSPTYEGCRHGPEECQEAQDGKDGQRLEGEDVVRVTVAVHHDKLQLKKE